MNPNHIGTNFDDFLKEEGIIMEDRFKFNAIVSSYYDIDTPEEYKEVEPQFYLKNVDVFCTGEIGVDYDTLLDAVKEQSKDLTEKEIGQIMQHFEDNSNSPDCEFVSITPDKIIQCTGLKDKNGKLIYEGDIVKMNNYILQIVYNKDYACFCAENEKLLGYFRELRHINAFEVIGNIYENKELLNDR